MQSILLSCYELIQSMSKNEKKITTVSLSKSNGKNHFLILFKVLNNAKELDEKKLKVQLQKRGVNNYKIIIHSLYKKILHILFENTQQHDRATLLRANLNYVYLLKGRNQYKSALSLLKSVEKEAEESQSYLILTDIMRLKRSLYILNENSLDEILECLEKEEALLERLNAFNQLDTLRVNLNQLYYNVDPKLSLKIKEQRTFLDKIKENYPEDLRMKNYLLEIELLQESEDKNDLKMLEVLEQKKAIYDLYPTFRAHQQIAYLRLLVNIALFYGRNNMPVRSLEIWENFIKEKHIGKHFKQHKIFILTNLEIRCLAIYIKTGIKNEFLESYIQENSPYQSKIQPSIQLYLIRYRATKAWFKKEIDAAINDLTIIKEDIKGELIIPIEVVTSKLYEGLLQVELENYLLLPNIVRQLKYLIKKIGNKYYEHKGASFITHWLSHVGRAAPLNKKRLKEILEAYIDKYPDYIHWEIMPSFYFSLWVRSILEDKKMITLVEENYHSIAAQKIKK
ncbi:hypothetical protein [Aureispira anguillae]|uniref:Uncharacterized protein n=1 Tax=Aureispira anguillae TaxID=2864201 RepID=A0A915YK60_9BACT|nr:hypothetical protein [Aureispira anguillae]BDS14565.1 hypothetical protein AsAng_0053460 [Aureispira anguillae]